LSRHLQVDAQFQDKKFQFNPQKELSGLALKRQIHFVPLEGAAVFSYTFDPVLNAVLFY